MNFSLNAYKPEFFTDLDHWEAEDDKTAKSFEKLLCMGNPYVHDLAPVNVRTFEELMGICKIEDHE